MIILKIERVGEEYVETPISYDELSTEEKESVIRGILDLTT